MTVRGTLRGCPIAIRLTHRESRAYRDALRAGYLGTGARIGMIEHAWEASRSAERIPMLRIQRGRRTASVILDLSTSDLQLDEEGVRDVKIVFFRAGSRAPNPAARGRMRRAIVTPAYAFARVPVRICEAVAEAILTVLAHQTRPSRAGVVARSVKDRGDGIER